jgi:RNA polymerase sigma-70 factor (ECF subfamily)
MNPPPITTPRAIEDASGLHEHERHLWGLCYRLTGSAADADDLVQDTFLRAMERPPARQDEPWRPWLVRVAVNLGRDALRRRRRRAYVGPWLPSPIDTASGIDDPACLTEPASLEDAGTEARYDLLESVSFAFLLALEALTPQQRAVLVLRDVLDYSVRETADALDLSEANVKTTHHRARRALEPYDRTRMRPTGALAAETRAALHRFLQAVTSGDVDGVAALLAEDACLLSDGGGEHAAARKPVLGRHRIANANVAIARKTSSDARFELRTLNGLPAIVVEQTPGPHAAPRFILQCALDADGRIARIYTVLAPRKLTAVRAVA